VSDHAALVSFRVGHHHMVGRAIIQLVLTDHGRARRNESLDRFGHPYTATSETAASRARSHGPGYVAVRNP
jgi:hypothetical protein